MKPASITTMDEMQNPPRKPFSCGLALPECQARTSSQDPQQEQISPGLQIRRTPSAASHPDGKLGRGEYPEERSK